VSPTDGVRRALGSNELPKRKPKRRTVRNTNKDRPGTFTRMRGVLDQPVLWEFAAAIPEQSAEGRRRKFPAIVYVAMASLAAVFGSFSAAESNLAEFEVWDIFCRYLCRYQAIYRPYDEPFDLEALLASTPLTAQNYYDARSSWLKPHYPGLQSIFEECAAQAAEEMSYADAHGKGSPNDLTRERTLAGDGKVTREPGSRYRALTQDEEDSARNIRVKTHVVDVRASAERGKKVIVAAKDMEGDAHLYMTGAGPVVGFKTVRLALRSDDTNSTITLCVRRPASKDEAACAVEAACDRKSRLPGILALVYDTAVRGTHIRSLARAGIVTIAPVTAAENPTGKHKSKERKEKNGKAGTYLHARPDGIACQHDLHYDGGQLYEQRVDAAGKKKLAALGDARVLVRDNATDHRMYHEWDIYCGAGLPTGATAARVGKARWAITDDSTQFNVAENLRAYAPGGPGYQKYYGWRQTIENDNHQSDARKVQRRGRSSRPDWNHINEMGWAIMNNGVALQRLRERRQAAQNSAPGEALAA
jgi:hypothetical protein